MLHGSVWAAKTRWNSNQKGISNKYTVSIELFDSRVDT